MATLVMLRHGQSEWNLQNLFTGWVDVPLSSKGIEEALAAGQRLKNLPIDVIFTSLLLRAQMTAMLAMSGHTSGKVPVIVHPEPSQMYTWGAIHSLQAQASIIPTYAAWQLNERMYGQLQGLNKQQTIEKYGKEQVQIWRRSFDIAPPEGESLAMTAARTLPYFQKNILPMLEEGKHVLISAHGNSLRSILMHIENYSPAEIVAQEIATGEPIFYEYMSGQFIKADEQGL